MSGAGFRPNEPTRFGARETVEHRRNSLRLGHQAMASCSCGWTLPEFTAESGDAAWRIIEAAYNAHLSGPSLSCSPDGDDSTDVGPESG